MSLKGGFSYIDVDVILGNCTIPFVIRILTKEYTKSLGYSSVCYVTSRIGWVSLKGVFSYIDVDVILGNCTIPFVIRILTKDQPPPSNLVIYSTMQCSTVEIMILYHK